MRMSHHVRFNHEHTDQTRPHLQFDLQAVDVDHFILWREEELLETVHEPGA